MNRSSHDQSTPKTLLSALLILVVLVCTTFAANTTAKPHNGNFSSESGALIPAHDIVRTPPKIQMAILLDTSNSMDGLIDQTRNQLWTVVNEFSTAQRHGVTPILEVALFEYGNDNLAAHQGYVRQLSSFTRELDRISEGLFSLQTNGGSEYCGYAIRSAVSQLHWSHSDADIKTIFIAGNEPFTQGPVNYHQAIALAKEKGISVNTIYAGDFTEGVQTNWQSGALLAGGDYMSINADRRIVHIDAPQDSQILALNNQLNATYIPYGAAGKESVARQNQQDEMSESISAGLLAKRAHSKASSLYGNSNWDLVDAYKDGMLSEDDLESLDADELPEIMQPMSSEERKDYVAEQARQRSQIQQEIVKLSEERLKYVAEKKKEQSLDSDSEEASISDALAQAVVKQAKQKGFELGE